MAENSTGVNTQEQKRSKEDPGKKRKRESAEKIPSTTDNIEVQGTESGAKNGASPGSAISQDMQLMLTVMREGFANLNRTLSNTSTSTANAIAEAFETFKGELEIALEEGSDQESAGTLDREVDEPPAKKRCERQSENYDEDKSGKSPEFEALINRSTQASNEGKSEEVF